MSTKACAFCDLEALRPQLIQETDQVIVIHARRPLAPGHMMVIPKRHQPDFLALTQEEGIALVHLVQRYSKVLQGTFSSAGLNIFSNIGAAAGQTIPHLHIHLLPRYVNEVQSPFQILQTPELYQKLERLSPEELKREIEKIQAVL